MHIINNIIKTLLLALIKGYRLCLSPVFSQFGGKCRFHPSCSDYGLEAIKIHGVWYGFWLTLKRFIKCSPLTYGGYDPVPKCNHKQKDKNIAPTT